MGSKGPNPTVLFLENLLFVFVKLEIHPLSVTNWMRIKADDTIWSFEPLSTFGTSPCQKSPPGAMLLNKQLHSERSAHPFAFCVK